MSYMSKERVGAISDGVIAVAATILVLELKVPAGTIESGAVVLHWSRLMAAWLISFMMIASVWFDNHLFLAEAPRFTTRMTVVTFVQLATVSLIPFVTHLAVDHFREIEAAIAFNIVMFFIGIISITLSLLIASAKQAEGSLNGAYYFRSRARLQLGIYVCVMIIALVGAFLHHPFLGILLWGLCPLIIGFRLKSPVRN